MMNEVLLEKGLRCHHSNQAAVFEVPIFRIAFPTVQCFAVKDLFESGVVVDFRIRKSHPLGDRRDARAEQKTPERGHPY